MIYCIWCIVFDVLFLVSCICCIVFGVFCAFYTDHHGQISVKVKVDGPKIRLTYFTPDKKSTHPVREGSQKKNVKMWVFDRTSLTPPPLKHIWGPLTANFFNHFFPQKIGYITLKMDFYWRKKSILLANMQVRGLWNAVRPPSEAFYLN